MSAPDPTIGPRPLPSAARLPAPHLQGWRLFRGLTSIELAARAGVSFGTVSRSENGRALRGRTLDALARALDVPVAALLSSAAHEAPPPGTPLVLRTRARVPSRATPRRGGDQRADPEYRAQLASFPVWLAAQQERPDGLGALARTVEAAARGEKTAASTQDRDRLRELILAAQGQRPRDPRLREAWVTWCHWCRNQRRRPR